MDTHSVRVEELVSAVKVGYPSLHAMLLDRNLAEDAIRSLLVSGMQRDFPDAWAYYTGERHDEQGFYRLTGKALAYLRLIDFLDHEGMVFADGNLHGQEVVSRPISRLRSLVRGEDVPVSPDFVEDMYHLFRLLGGEEPFRLPTRSEVQGWMDRHPTGLDKEVIAWREENKRYIAGLLAERIRSENRPSPYKLKGPADPEKDLAKVLEWWKEDRFHLRYAIRSAAELDRYLRRSSDDRTRSLMEQAERKGIPVFATPHFLSLIDTRPADRQECPGSDMVLRDYLFCSEDLVEEFGSICAWEKEDVAEPGKPNAAGWILPSRNIHRRYPNVAIFIPDTMGRACGGLCAYCQRMYDFQAGRFNFELDKLKPKRSWESLLQLNMEYFRTDPCLSDILVTGGDALMSSVPSLEHILDAVLKMAHEKLLDNEKRPEGARYATMKRVRLGTKLPVYLPQRITPRLTAMLARFKENAALAGISQCIVQVHISSSMEITPETKTAIGRLLSAGWAVTDQEVFTVSASRRGHSARLRQTLNEIGVLPYYTFTVKGFKENRHLFANNARSTQEQIEESSIGRVALRYHSVIKPFISDAAHMVENIDGVRKSDEIPFLSTDRNTLNLPGVGKSNTYRTVGLTDDGRRILEFEFDHTRPHSPVIEQLGSVIVIESKSIAAYLRQLEQIGEDRDEYGSIWGYSAGSLEPRSTVFDGMAK
jgi:lysine 2,3-aminomutase